MIFVILGTQKFQLNRLLKIVDKEIELGNITEPVFAQIGNSEYIPKNYEWTQFMDKYDFEKKIKESDVVISHSGVGSIISAINENKPVIVFPRLKEYGEHVDDHQSEIAEAFAKKRLVLRYDETKTLYDQINKAREFVFGTYESKTEQIVNKIDEFITKCCEN